MYFDSELERNSKCQLFIIRGYYSSNSGQDSTKRSARALYIGCVLQLLIANKAESFADLQVKTLTRELRYENLKLGHRESIPG